MKVVPVLQSCLFVTESFLFLLLPKQFFFFFLQCCFVKRRGKSAVHSGEWQVIKQKFRFCQPRRKGGRGEKERKRNKFLLLPIFIQVSFSIWLTRNQHRHEPSQVLISTKKKDFMMSTPAKSCIPFLRYWLYACETCCHWQLQWKWPASIVSEGCSLDKASSRGSDNHPVW